MSRAANFIERRSMLRDDIIKTLRRYVPKNKTHQELSDEILSLPSGMVRVEKCKHGDSTDREFVCNICQDSGEILIDISVGEEVSLLREFTGGLYGAEAFRQVTGVMVRVK